MGGKGGGTVGSEAQLGEEVVGHGLADVGAVHFESAKHEAGPKHDAQVDLADEGALFPPGPAGGGVEAVVVFPGSIGKMQI